MSAGWSPAHGPPPCETAVTLASELSTVDLDGGTGEEGGLVGQEPGDGGGDLVRPSKAAERDLRADLLACTGLLLDRPGWSLSTALQDSGVMSTSTTSGRNSSACRSASSPVDATPTTLRPSRSRRLTAASRKDGLSSTMRQRSATPSASHVWLDGALQVAGIPFCRYPCSRIQASGDVAPRDRRDGSFDAIAHVEVQR
jgi:hypothetical protein